MEKSTLKWLKASKGNKRFIMVALDGLEPSLPKEPDFESGVSTNSTTAPILRGELPRKVTGRDYTHDT